MNRVDLVKLLIEHGADVERAGLLGRLDDAERPVADLLDRPRKESAGLDAARACRPDVSTNELHRVTVLLDYGASVDDRGRYGLTALHYAVRGGKLPLIKLLLERGARSRRAGRRRLDAAVASVEDTLEGRSDSGDGTAGRKRSRHRCAR